MKARKRNPTNIDPATLPSNIRILPADEFQTELSQAQLNELRTGDHVKLCVKLERFWVMITKIVTTGEGNHIGYRGLIANHLTGTAAHGLSCGDSVEFPADLVIDRAPTSPDRRP